MKLFLWQYNCVCGNVFESPGLDEFCYGEFLLRNDSNEVRYLNTFSDPLFDEIATLIKCNDNVKNRENINLRSLIQSILSIAIDLSSNGSPFKIGEKEKCPKCNSTKRVSWGQIYPVIVVDTDITEVTHNHWNSLSSEDKKSLVNEAILMRLLIKLVNVVVYLRGRK